MDNQNGSSEVQKMKVKLQSVELPANLKEKATHQIERIALTLKYGGNLSQIDITSKYIEWITSLPWNAKTEDVLDIKKAKEALDKNHFGLEPIKRRVLEYLSVLIIQRQKAPTDAFHAPQLFFVGLVGTGKTTFSQSLA